MTREGLLERRGDLVMHALRWGGMHVPRPIALTFAELYPRLYYDRSGKQREIVAANLSRVLGHPANSALVQSAARESFRLYARYWYDTFALRTMPLEEVAQRFSIAGIEHLDRAVENGRGIIVALPHMGNWDAAGHWLAAVRGYRMTAVAEELKPESVFELFLRHRRALGMNIVPLKLGKRVGEILVQLLAQNHVITLVADRDIAGRGVDVEMFGAPRRLPAGPAFLSLVTGSPLAAACVYTTDDGWHTVLNPPLEFERSGETRKDVTRLTRLIAAQFESFIAAAPADWHMFQPAWDDDGRSQPVSQRSEDPATMRPV